VSLREISLRLTRELRALDFALPVDTVYRPLEYAWAPHEEFLERFGAGPKEVLLVGMNPGPWGMAQTGIPFGAVSAVRDWIGLHRHEVQTPPRQHPKRPIEGFACPREEVSGTRLWGWARRHWETPERFFERLWVANYCPLLFLEASGRNLPPDKLGAAELASLLPACDRALREVAAHLEVSWVIGIGVFAEKRARAACADLPVSFGRILHPSPASPAANRGWEEQATLQFEALGLQLP
jgi:single-strand selective monofunctional uracil DNA glycosylase